MADTIRETIIANLITRLAVIKTTAGYNSNIGNTVERAKKDMEKTYPACCVWPFPEESETSKYGTHICTFPIHVEAIFEYGSVNPSVAQEQVLGDLIKCVTDPSVTWTTKTKNIRYQSGGPESFPNAGEKTTGVKAVFEIKYETKKGDPYNQ